MTTFPNASNPKKKMTKIIADDARDMNLNRKRKYEEKIQRAREIAIMITYLVEILTIPFHRVARLNI